MFRKCALAGAVVVLTACGSGEAASPTPSQGPLVGAQREAARTALTRQATLGQDVTLPPNAAELDKAEAAYDYARVRRLMADAPDRTSLLTWSKIAVFRGGGFALSQFYSADLLQMSSAYDHAASDTPADRATITRTAQNLRGMGEMIALYSLAVIQEDGLRCADETAPLKHMNDALKSQNSAFVSLRAKPEAERRQAVDAALALSVRTVPVRGKDTWLCYSELPHWQAEWSRQGQERPRTDARTPGRDVEIVLDPALMFVDDETWWSRVESSRRATAALLEKAAGL